MPKINFNPLSGKFDLTENKAGNINITDVGGYYAGTEVESALQEVGAHQAFYDGTFLESFTAVVTSDGATVTMNLQKAGGGDLTMNFSDGQTKLDCTPASTIELTTATLASPQGNWIYIPKTTKVLTKSINDWPTGEHIKIAYFLVPDATYAQNEGVLINQNWNDHSGMTTDGMGHMAHMAERMRADGAIYFSGVDPNGTDQAAASSYFNYVDGTNSYYKSAAGIIMQMHRHTYTAKDTQTGDDMHVVNSNAGAYEEISRFNEITTDSQGVTLTNRFFNIVIWGVANQSGEYSPVMVNLPDGSYNNQTTAQQDASGYDNLSLPREFSLDSSTGFLICRMTLKNTSGNLTHISTLDLRGQTPTSASGGATGTVTRFADNVFEIYDETDNTKEIAFQASGITTGNMRVITMPDADTTLLTQTQVTDLTDGGATTLHSHAIAHNDTTSKQGGTTNEYYHLTSAEATVVGNTSGTNTGDQDLTPYLKKDGSNDPITGNITIDVNSTTALLVEQNGVKDNTLVVDTTNGFVGINVEPTQTLHVSGGAIISNGNAGGGISLGADVNSNTRSNNVRKVGVITCPTYNNTDAPVEIFSFNAATGLANIVGIGGRVGGSNTGATTINFIANAGVSDTGGTVIFSGTTAGLTMADGMNIVFNTTTGTQIGTATTQKLAFYGKTPIVQPASADQAAAPAGGTGATAGAYNTAANRDKLINLVNAMRTVLVNNGLMKGSA